ncbi:MAG: DUF2298 domain-containing protein [Anaerolineaceae bacterium]|nr:DUF2298 domain-containing protein [Anaerolineaceae bacterium]
MNRYSQDERENMPASGNRSWIWGVLLLGIILLGAYFRYSGLDWDQNHHLHPDERFLTMVETGIAPVDSISEYFNTAESSLNPNNRGFGFFVYGTLPIFMVRYLGEWLGQTGFDQIQMIGRAVSGTLDLLIVLLVYLIALRLYGKQRLALLAAAFSAFSVLPIQISHYFVVDNYTNFFIVLTMYIAVVIATKPIRQTEEAIEVESDQDFEQETNPLQDLLLKNWDGIGLYLLFGMALGMAVASKINAAPAAVLLPAAGIVWLYRLLEDRRDDVVWLVLRNLVMGAVVSLITFRIFQPYAFNGPGFFGFGLNPDWIETIKQLAAQTSGDVDFPPALQWARRPIWFSGQNMILWGLGLPLGTLAWSGFIGMGWRMLRRNEWRIHAVLWGWTAIYFTWQSFNGNPTMRYQLPVYPALAVIAAWAIFALWEWVKEREVRKNIQSGWQRAAVIGLGFVVLAGTFAWAFAFTRIYARPVTRVEASEWIYQNVPAAINLRVASGGSDINFPISFNAGYTATASQPLVMAFSPRESGNLTGLAFAHVLNRAGSTDLAPVNLNIIISTDREGKAIIASGQLASAFDWGSEQRGSAQEFFFTVPVALTEGESYYLRLRPDEGITLDFAGLMALKLNNQQGNFQQALAEPMGVLREGSTYTAHFDARDSGTLHTILLPWVVDWEQVPAEKTLRFKVIQPDATEQILGQVDLVSALPRKDDPRGESYSLNFTPPIEIVSGRQYLLQIEFVEGSGAVAFYGSTQAKESSWDDPLPVGLYGLSPYDYHTGLFRTELNFEMYWNDNSEKLDRFTGNLDQADYLFISSNRQWGTTTRVSERYPLTTSYYRNLLGCPEDKDILWCYRVAESSMFEGNLGFELVKVVQSDPNLGSLRINTQFAEEAFTVYDHPKVLIFQKRSDYDPNQVRDVLGSVDLSTVVHVTPKQATKHPGSLLLPEERLAQQRAGGTWSDLFNSDALYNRFPWLGVVLWYAAVSLLGWVMVPLVRLAFDGLPDKGYPFVRLMGMLLTAYLTWIIGSVGIAVTRTTISVVILLLLAINAILFWKQRLDLRQMWQSERRAILIAEIVFLAFFLIDLMIRTGNPDLWHPYKGGEKPMDFSYFQAVLKSTTFPPYDPWFAGGYINYYYYGFVVVGVLVKWLGIEPAIAYNLILPTLFAFVGAGAFSIGWNLFAGKINLLRLPARKEDTVPAINSAEGEQDERSDIEADESLVTANIDGEEPAQTQEIQGKNIPLFAGLSASLAVLILGNLGTVRMIIQGFQRMAAPGGNVDGGVFYLRWLWFFQGIGRFIQGTPLPYPPGDWYWIPSRAIPGNVITEFPNFTFLYADLHAHMIALPITLLALAWTLSILKGRWKWRAQGDLPGWVQFGASFFCGALIIGALRPTNTWDFPTYLLIAGVSVAYTFLRYQFMGDENQAPAKSVLKIWPLLGSLALLLLLTWVLYQPFGEWYGAGYTSIMRWKIDEHTPIASYLVHWGLFLFLIASWMVWETLDWMDAIPVSNLIKLRKYAGVIYGGLALVAGLTILLAAIGVSIVWLALPLAAWAGLLLLRAGQPDEKRLVLFLVGSALFMTLFVEVFVLEGDIGRMNTVFKFYLQAWIMFAISAAAALFWLLPVVLKYWSGILSRVWLMILGTLFFAAALFPITAGIDKATDRISQYASHSLDGMTYMQSAQYSDQGVDMDLNQDYQAIQWMLENVEGSPVIVEGNTPEYRWGSRFTINTGLPGVVGWNWHQRQQRGVVSSEWVTMRVEAITMFYTTSNRSEVEDFLRRYDVQYIVVGQLEKAYYPGPGLNKFEDWDGDLWQGVYRQGDTVIYQTLLYDHE